MKAIITTTIHPPTEAIKKFADKKDWKLYVVGDMKTPHHLYENLNLIYLHPDEQDKRFKSLSDSIGWNCIQRRNIGFVQAYLDGAEIFATVDDDNIPLDDWGEDLLLDSIHKMNYWENKNGLFDPLSITDISNLWHRGYPLEYVIERHYNTMAFKNVVGLVQANLWTGKPDIDAVCKIIYKDPSVDDINADFPYASNSTIFSSQNAFIHRSVMPHYAVLPHAHRMDDIWGSIILQQRTKCDIIFSKPTTFHERNQHDLISDLMHELIGHKMTKNIIEKGENALPDQCKNFLEEYNKAMQC